MYIPPDACRSIWPPSPGLTAGGKPTTKVFSFPPKLDVPIAAEDTAIKAEEEILVAKNLFVDGLKEKKLEFEYKRAFPVPVLANGTA